MYAWPVSVKGRSFRLGDSVSVKVMRADLDERKIDFELGSGAAGRGRAARAGGWLAQCGGALFRSVSCAGERSCQQAG